MARALWKATLECVYLDHGDFVFDQRFDTVRAMVRGDLPAAGYLLFQKEGGPPTTEVSLTYDFFDSEHGPLLPAKVVIAGVPFFTELLQRVLLGDREQAETLMNVIEF